MKAWWFMKAAKFAVLMAVGLVVFGALVMALWNALVPDLFHGPTLSFWQAIGLLLLSHILFRSWSPWRHSNGWRHDRWRHRLEDKLSAMTPEERDKFKEEWRRRCGWSPEDIHGKKDQPAA